MATRKSEEAEFEEAYERHGVSVKKAKQEYDAIYQRMMEKISSEDIKPFADIAREHDHHILDIEFTLSSLKKVVMDEILSSWNNIWEGSLSIGMTKLEMLKEHYKKFEGTDWKVGDKTVDERLLPHRIRNKQIQIHWLEKQIAHQNKLLSKKYEETENRRELINRVSDDALKLIEHATKYDSSAQKQELKKEFHSLLFYPDKE